MATITRRDGQQFVVQAYRERLEGIKHSRMVKEIRALADEHGQFVRVFAKESHFDIAFATEPGYLLGETVRQYFGFARELIYCEYLPESRQVILVVVRGGNVYIDTKVSLTQFAAELVPALTGEQRYAIHLYGEVPMSPEQETDKVYVPEQFIASFEQHDDSLFGRLPIVAKFQLLPLPYALKSAFDQGQKPWLAIAVVAAFFVFLLWWVLIPNKSTRVMQQAQQQPQHPYAAYDHALETPDPSRQINYLVHVINSVYHSPGWQAVQIHYQSQGVQVIMKTDGGDMRTLQQFADQHHYQLQFTDQGAVLSLAAYTSPRPEPKAIYQLTPMVERLSDTIDALLGDHAIVLGARGSHGHAESMAVTIMLQRVSPAVLSMLAFNLQDLPVTLNEVNLTMDQQLLSGSINLDIWGD